MRPNGKTRFHAGSVLLAILLALTLSTFTSSRTAAQVRVGVSFQTYSPPAWAPPYDNVSTTEYYYLPDYQMYYDVWTGEFWYQNNGEWAYSVGLPPMYANADLNSAYVVLIDRRVEHPWMNHDFYVRNYPQHSYDNYRNIVVRNRIVTNIEPNHELVPRAYNENNHRVTFMQHPVGGKAPNTYHRVAHEVPIESIAPSMPKATRSFNYGGARNRPSPARTAAPVRGSAHANGGQHGGGNGHGDGGGNSHDGGGNNKH